MKKFTKILALVLAFALTAALSVSLTLAYLTDKDEKVNVMTLGNVNIEQHEYERVTDANGNWIPTGETDKYGYTPDKLQVFTQAKPLYPAVFADGDIKWDDRNGSQNPSGEGSHQQSWAQVGASGSSQLFDDSVKNAQDKFVFVENTGKSDAYVRTWIALEQGALAADDFPSIIMTNLNGNQWSWEVADTDVVIGDGEYYVLCATYLGPKSNPTGILAPNTVSYPSLMQVYMKPEATNEDCAAIDSNGNGTYDILVFSQAVQTEGFDNAQAALTAGFGTNHPWTTDTPAIPEVVEAADVADMKGELADALADGATDVVVDCGGADIGTLNYGLNKNLVPAGTTVTIENANVSGRSYGNGVDGTVIFSNCTFTNTGAYSIHFDNGTGKVIFNNCVLEGWCSVGSTISSVELNNCTLKGNGKYAMLRCYQDTTLNNCIIDCSDAPHDDVYVDGISVVYGTMTLNNCTITYADVEAADGGKIISDGKVLAPAEDGTVQIKNDDWNK